MAINFETELTEFQINKPNIYANWLRSVITEHNKKLGDIQITFVNDIEIVKINSNFLNHNYPTDIITFDNSFLDTISGEIYISIDTVNDNAGIHTPGFKQKELERVLVHGVLHLVGYADSTEEEKKKMRQMENLYLDVLHKEILDE